MPIRMERKRDWNGYSGRLLTFRLDASLKIRLSLKPFKCFVWLLIQLAYNPLYKRAFFFYFYYNLFEKF
jgi:hypothetical protein